MNVTIANYILNILLEGFYVCICIWFITTNIFQQKLLTNDIYYLKQKQDVLHQSILQLKIIIDIDKEMLVRLQTANEENTEEEEETNEENTEEEEETNDEDTEEEETNDEDTEEEEEEENNDNNIIIKPVFPIQNHITFPHFTIFDDSNYISTKKNMDKKYLDKKYLDKKYLDKKYNTLKDNTRLMSNQLAIYLHKKQGSCITFDEVFLLIWKSVCWDWKESKYELKKLFGITENEDYEISNNNLSNYLEPHLKNIN